MEFKYKRIIRELRLRPNLTNCTPGLTSVDTPKHTIYLLKARKDILEKLYLMNRNYLGMYVVESQYPSQESKTRKKRTQTMKPKGYTSLDDIHIHIATSRARRREVAAAVPTVRRSEPASDFRLGNVGSHASPL